MRITGLLAFLIWLAAGSAATAQGTVAPTVTAVPTELVLYVHQDLQADEMVRQLVCQLSAVLVAPVRSEPIDFPIDASLIAGGNELDSERVIRRLYGIATQRTFGTDSFALMLIPYYLRNGKTSTSGTTFGLPYNMGVVSIASLYAPGADLGKPEIRRLVARRAFKVSFRYVAHMSGLWKRSGCVLAYPYGVAGIDRKPAELCEDDRAALVEAGVVKRAPGAGCDAIASAR